MPPRRDQCYSLLIYTVYGSTANHGESGQDPCIEHFLIGEGRADKGERKRLAAFVNDRRSNCRHLTIKQQPRGEDTALLAISTRPFYLQREVSHVVIVAVCIPPPVNTDAAFNAIRSGYKQAHRRYHRLYQCLCLEYPNHQDPAVFF